MFSKRGQAMILDEKRDLWEKEWRCPYCGDPSSEEWPVCCGENHCEEYWIDENGEMVERVGE